MINEVLCLQFFPREKYAFFLPTYYEAKMRELRVRSIVTNVEYFI